jgi:hypothetical protein
LPPLGVSIVQALISKGLKGLVACQRGIHAP